MSDLTTPNTEKFNNLIKYMTDYAFSEAIKSATQPDVLKDTNTARLLTNIEAMFDNLGVKMAEWLPPEIAKLYFEGIDNAHEHLASQGIEMPGKALLNGKITTDFKTKVHVEAVNEIVNDTMMDLAAAIRTAKESYGISYENALNQIRDDIAKGLVTGNNREYIINKVKTTLSSNGFTSFTTIDGKKLPLDFYARTVTRTKLRMANNHGHANRLTELGHDLYYVTGRNPTCGECAKYRGHVFSMSGEDDRFPYLDPFATFPVHPNCQCMIRPWVETYKTEDELQEAIEHAKNFNPNRDPRTKAQREAYAHDQKLKRIARQEEKHYLLMKSIIGPKAPKTIGAYRNIKRNNPAKFEELKTLMKEVKKPVTNVIDKPKELKNVKASKKTIGKVAKEAVKQNKIKEVAKTLTDDEKNQETLKKVLNKQYDKITDSEKDVYQSLMIAANADEIPDNLRNNYYDMIFKAKSRYNELRTTDPDAFESVQRYTGNLYFEINDYLMGNNGPRNSNTIFEEHIDNINRWLNAQPIEKEIVTFRGMGKFEFEDMKNEKYKTMRTFRSTSIDFNTVESFSNGYYAEFRLQPGTPAAYIELASQAPGERELLVSNEAVYKVVEVDENKLIIEVYKNE